MENKKLTRSNNRMLAGVCAGLADYFGLDVTVVRIISDNRRHYAMPRSSTSNINVEKAGIGPLVRLPYPIV